MDIFNELKLLGLQEDIDKRNQRAECDKVAAYFAALRQSLINEGFTDAQAFELITLVLKFGGN